MNIRMILQMIRLSFWIAILFAGAWLGEKMHDDPGFVLISVAGYRIEMTAWLGLGLLLISWVLVYYSIRILANLRIDRHFVNWNQQRSKKATENRLQQGLYQLARGNFKAAERLFQKTAAKSSHPSMGYLLAAFSAHASGKKEQCDHWLTSAIESKGSDEVLSGLLQAQLQMHRGEAEQALATLGRMQGQDRNPFKLELLRRVLVQLEDWDQLESVLLAVKKSGLKGSAKVEEVEKALYLKQFDHLDLEQLQKRWKQLSGAVKKDTGIVLSYANRLSTLGLNQPAEEVLQQSIHQQFDPELILQYGLLNYDPKRQLITAERWLREKPADSCLLITLGRLSLKLKQWGKAQEYLNLAVDINNHPLAHAELARFYGAKKDYTKSSFHYERCMKASYELPQLPEPSSESSNHG